MKAFLGATFIGITALLVVNCSNNNPVNNGNVAHLYIENSLNISISNCKVGQTDFGTIASNQTSTTRDVAAGVTDFSFILNGSPCGGNAPAMQGGKTYFAIIYYNSPAMSNSCSGISVIGEEAKPQ